MRPLRFLVAVTASVVVIVSAPFVQQLFSTVSTNWGPQSRMLGIGATVVPIGIALLAAIARIRDRRATRYLMLASGLLLGWSGVLAYESVIAFLQPQALWLLAAGGLLYSFGVVFHVWRSLPYQNAIWHAFVLAGTACHYGTVLTSVLASGGPA